MQDEDDNIVLVGLGKFVKMFGEIVNYLRDPQLVAEFQKFFGVDVDAKSSKPSIINDDAYTSIKRNGISELNGKRNEHAIHHEQLELDKTTNEEKQLPIKNWFWYYLFLFGTELGDETFYCAFIPFWFWNIDGAVGRRIVLVWAIVMTIGQALKDIICWPRPACPPAVRLQSKWSQEYGMPSTHAMVGVSIPFSVVIFTINRYIYSVPAGCLTATIW